MKRKSFCNVVLSLFLVATSIFLLFVGTGCGCGNENGASVTYELRLETNNLRIEKYSDSVTVNATAKQSGIIVNQPELTWESSDKNIFTVDNSGVIVPKNEGSAELSVTWQGKTEKCIVTVYSEGRVPSIKTDRDSIGFLLSDEPIVINAYVLFGDKKYYSPDVSFSYAILESGKDVAEVDENGIVTPKGYGNTLLIVSANFRGYAGIGMQIEIPISVCYDLETHISLKTGCTSEIYVNEIVFDGVEYKKTTAFDYSVSKASEDGKITEISDADVVWHSSDENVACVDENGVVTAISWGTCNIWCVYSFEGVESVSEKVAVTVNEYLIIDKVDDVTITIDYRKEFAFATVAEIFGTEYEGNILGVYKEIGGRNLLSDGKLDVTEFTDGKFVLIVKNDSNYAYCISAEFIIEPIQIVDIMISEDSTVSELCSNGGAPNQGDWTKEYDVTVGEKTVIVNFSNYTQDPGWGDTTMTALWGYNVDETDIQKAIDLGYNSVALEVYFGFSDAVNSISVINVALLDDNSNNSDYAVNTWHTLHLPLSVFKEVVSTNGYTLRLFPVTAGNETTTGTYSIALSSIEYEDYEGFKVSSVALDRNSADMRVGETLTLNATVLPNTALNKSLTWESSNSNIVTVSNGQLTAIAEGVATIIVRSVDGNYYDECTVNVTGFVFVIDSPLLRQYETGKTIKVPSGKFGVNAATVTVTTPSSTTIPVNLAEGLSLTETGNYEIKYSYAEYTETYVIESVATVAYMSSDGSETTFSSTAAFNLKKGEKIYVNSILSTQKENGDSCYYMSYGFMRFMMSNYSNVEFHKLTVTLTDFENASNNVVIVLSILNGDKVSMSVTINGETKSVNNVDYNFGVGIEIFQNAYNKFATSWNDSAKEVTFDDWVGFTSTKYVMTIEADEWESGITTAECSFGYICDSSDYAVDQSDAYIETEAQIVDIMISEDSTVYELCSNGGAPNQGYWEKEYDVNVDGKIAIVKFSNYTQDPGWGDTTMTALWNYNVSASDIQKAINLGYNSVALEVYFGFSDAVNSISVINVALLDDNSNNSDYAVNTWHTLHLPLSVFKEVVSTNGYTLRLFPVTAGNETTTGIYSIALSSIEYENYDESSDLKDIMLLNTSEISELCSNGGAPNQGYWEKEYDINVDGKTAIVKFSNYTQDPGWGDTTMTALWKYNVSASDIQKAINLGYNSVALEVYFGFSDAVNSISVINVALLDDNSNNSDYAVNTWHTLHLPLSVFKEVVSTNGYTLRLFPVTAGNETTTGTYSIALSSIEYE